MNRRNLKRLIILSIPYVVLGLVATNLGEAWRIAKENIQASPILGLMAALPAAFTNFMPSFHPFDLCVGIVCGCGLRLAVYLRGKNAKKYRHNEEYGSARWGNAQDIAPFVAPKFEDNIILTQTERLMMSNRPANPKNARNKNVLIVGGSGSGKTRFWIKPNLLQCHSSYVVTDPKGSIVVECGNALLKKGYHIKIFNTINFQKSMLNRIIPYFDEHHPSIRLNAITAKHIQDYYTYEMEVNHVSANTVKHRHANIHKALSYAYKTDMIQTNPADKVELPKVEKYSGNVYNKKQLEELFQAIKGDPAEFGVVTAAFYGLRRSEVVGLKWDAVDFEKKTITIKHTIQQTKVDGKLQIVPCDRTKTKSSCRILPLVAPYEAILLKMRENQEENRKLCGSCYCTDYLDYIYVNEIGEIIKPDYLTTHFKAFLEEHNMPHIRFHDLRHSCATLLFAQGVPMKEIQAWLGHSTIGTTANIYTHLDENSKINSANAIIGILEQKKDTQSI